MMRLQSIYISDYKNLKNFKLDFDGQSFIDVFVGKNGTGKSNLFEALIEIFQHLYEFGKYNISFDYSIKYQIGPANVEITWQKNNLLINGASRKTLRGTPLPDNVLIYYSGHNTKVTSLVQLYEETFKKAIKKADIRDTRKFIGIGKEYKQLLLSILLMQKNDSKAKSFICQKLGIQAVAPLVKIILQRPFYANASAYDIVNNDETDRYWKPEGITKTFLDRLSRCIDEDKGSPVRSEGYFPANDARDEHYILYFSIEKIQEEFNDLGAQELFRQFDNLKTLVMLQDISIDIKLDNGADATTDYFSDGQFQSVYIYSIVELFKDRNCLTLLDEPDCFLHPEWQFAFLNQVFEITETTTKNNHILMSSHSASTITSLTNSLINIFEISGNKIVVNRIAKPDVIKSLSAGLITFSESEARLSIHHILHNTTGAVVFTEGITDEMILETAWSKLFSCETRKFEIQNAFSCGFLRNLIKDGEIFRNYPGRIFFSIFDFDKAYDDWNQLGTEIQSNPSKCLTRKHNDCEAYSLLLPVPSNPTISKQVINPNNGKTYGSKSLLTTELLFHGIEGLEKFFVVDVERTDGFFKFISDKDKVSFAKDIVPTIEPKHFEVFRPMFDFIKSKC
jgi:predicted ATP-dependent endonuclease of OLD family